MLVILLVCQVIILCKGVLEIFCLIEDDDKLLKIQIGVNYICMFFIEFIFISKLVDGCFFDYCCVFFKDGDKIILVSKDVLKDVFFCVVILLNEKFCGVCLNIFFGELKIMVNNLEQEEVEEIVDIDYQGDFFEIGFNVVYLIDVLNFINFNNVKINFMDVNFSVFIEDVDDGVVLYVIMFMCLQVQ